MRNTTYGLLLIKRRRCETAHVYTDQSLSQSGLLPSTLILSHDSLDTIPLSVLYLLFIYIQFDIERVYLLYDCKLCFSFKGEFYSKIVMYSKSQMVVSFVVRNEIFIIYLLYLHLFLFLH